MSFHLVDLVPVVCLPLELVLDSAGCSAWLDSLVEFPFAVVNLGWSVRLAARGTLSRFAVSSAE